MKPDQTFDSPADFWREVKRGATKANARRPRAPRGQNPSQDTPAAKTTRSGAVSEPGVGDRTQALERIAVWRFMPQFQPERGFFFWTPYSTTTTTPHATYAAAVVAAEKELRGMTQQMTTKPILKYPGAKWNLAPWIISHFPAHAHYVEPYFGSGAVFFNKQPAKHEVINDLSGDVVNLFRVIRVRGEELAALIEMTPWSREEYELSYQTCDEPMERARRLIVRVWQGHGSDGMRGGMTWSGLAKRSGAGDVSARNNVWRTLPAAIHELAIRLCAAHIENADATKLIRAVAHKDTLIYADPPYPFNARSGGKYYLEDCMTDADHLELLNVLDAHPGPVVLSGYHCALYDDRLTHWHTREKQAQAEKGNTRTEVLWLNQVCIDKLGMGPMFAVESEEQ